MFTAYSLLLETVCKSENTYIDEVILMLSQNKIFSLVQLTLNNVGDRGADPPWSGNLSIIYSQPSYYHFLHV